MEKMEVTSKCYSVADKVVRKGTDTNARVHVPVSWLGKKVRLLLLDPIDSEE